MKNLKFKEWAFLLTFFMLTLAFAIDVIHSIATYQSEIEKLAASIRSLGGVYLLVKLGPWANDD